MAICTITLSTGLEIMPDTAEAVTHTREAEATNHPVEDGSAIADHIIVKPKTFSITTNWTPRPWDESMLPSGADRPDKAFTILADAVQSKASVFIEIDRQFYAPVVIEKVTMQRQFEDGDGRTIMLECKEITIVAGKTVAIKVAPKLKAKGTRRTKKVDPKTLMSTEPPYLDYSLQQSTAQLQQTVVVNDAPVNNPKPPAKYVQQKKAAEPVWKTGSASRLAGL